MVKVKVPTNPSAEKHIGIICPNCNTVDNDYFDHCANHCCPNPKCERYSLQRPHDRLAKLEYEDGTKYVYVVFEAYGQPTWLVPPEFCEGTHQFESPPTVSAVDENLVIRVRDDTGMFRTVEIGGQKLDKGDWEDLEVGGAIPGFPHQIMA
ncbi:hypothetical protein S7711_10407 [Stachybotrys chartarum IBT 7711]|uniref:Uncharacterized protein n=1 Tax=Stachybotrys chartarum (strain CBS 109288 / IBT 7711) TaxID=1280523 RepID=A0A084B489_STACB|nr:hypothetical protein S7711_10407 [Stachybotrys chartarum IBT 7711]KFA54352.1 hypothetical protein S40293_10852 [Stachybotrys chartarum IBT 40293]